MLRPEPTPGEVATFLQWDAETAPTIAPHLVSVTAFVRSYTRGVGFTTTTEGPYVEQDVAAVIVSATCRSVTNPEQVSRVEVGSYNAMPARFEGFTLVEQIVLNNYRRRTA